MAALTGPAKVAIVVGAKGRGSNMIALLDAMRPHLGLLAPYVVVAPRGGTAAASYARADGVRVEVAADDAALAKALEGCDVVCLAGYARLVPPDLVARYRGRMLNVHPALLPKHGGKGMYGMRVHEAVIAAAEPRSGCTVHLVDEAYDHGETILQMECSVMLADTPETLAARVLALEHIAYPKALLDLVRTLHE